MLAGAAAHSAPAQSYHGALRGTVHDRDRVVPGVAIVLTSESTNLTRSTVTDERGDFQFGAVVPDVYSLEASLSGFKTYTTVDHAARHMSWSTLTVPAIGTICGTDLSPRKAPDVANHANRPTPDGLTEVV